MKTRIVNLSLPDSLVSKIDQAAKASYASRSDYIRESIVLRLNGQHIAANKLGQSSDYAGEDEYSWENYQRRKAEGILQD